MVAAGVIWILTAIAYVPRDQSHALAEILRHNVVESAELMLFFLSAMTFINTMSKRNIFKALRVRLVTLGLSLRAVFWLTGLLAFFLSPIADNLTTALVMGGAWGYLAVLSDFLYGGLGATTANILVGILSAVIDHIPVTFAVLSMKLDMSLGQWLLVTLTAGVGGSLLSVGSTAGVALMGQARRIYTFSANLKWIWAIALGYAASIAVHLMMNSALFFHSGAQRSEIALANTVEDDEWKCGI